MAHSCPDCGSICHCNGDIDDIDFGDTEPNCRHCDCPICKKPIEMCDCPPVDPREEDE